MPSVNSLFSHSRLKSLYFDEFQRFIRSLDMQVLNDAEPASWSSVMLSNVHSVHSRLQFEWRMIDISLFGERVLPPKDMVSELPLLDNGQRLLVIGMYLGRPNCQP